MKKCTIIVTDEVNCKIQGLELSDRKALVKMFEYEKPGARYLPSVKLGRWNGKVSYFGLGGLTYINLLPDIIPVIDKAGYDIELQDTRNYNTTFAFDRVSEEVFSSHVWPDGHQSEGEPILLRDYQVSLANLLMGNPGSIISAATGSGKTLLTAALSYSVQKYGRSLVIVPNQSLVLQTETDYINVGLDVGVFFGGRKEFGKTHTICTWQSLNSLLKKTQAGEAEISIGEFLDGVVCVIIDEAHGIKAEALKTLLTGEMAHIPIRWAMTGTIPKAKFEAQALFVSIGPLVGELPTIELQDRGVLAQCHVNIIQLQDSVEYANYQSELKFLLEDSKRLDKIAQVIDVIKDSGNTLILVDRVNAGKELVDRIPGSVFISGNTKLADRKEEYDEVAVLDGKVLVCTYGIAAVGINLPRLFNIVLIEPGKSFVRVIQSIGRGLRKASDKDHVEIWDICSSTRFSKRHLTQRKVFYKEAQYPFSLEKISYR